MAQDVLCFGIKLDGLAVESLFERMPDQRLVLMVLDAYGVWPILAAIVGPSQKTGHHILGPLQPLKADHCDGRGFGPAFLNAAPRKFIDLLAGDRVLLGLGAALEGEVVPGVRVFLIEQLRVQPTHDTPGLATEADHFLALPQPESVRPVDDLVVDFVSGPWRDFHDLPLADPPSALTDGIADHLHDPFVVRA